MELILSDAAGDRSPPETELGSAREPTQKVFSSEATLVQKITYAVLAVVVTYYTVVSIFASWLAPPCDLLNHPRPANATFVKHPNPDYDSSRQGETHEQCHLHRYLILGGMNYWECDMSARVAASLLCGTIIGWERRRADRPAGIRTMALVCLGSCVFTLGSIFAFIDGPMAWDASRVSAAIPSGVGFLGAASIWKGTKAGSTNGKDNGTTAPEVHGLTTATSVWLSAAIGILCGGALYVPALFVSGVSVTYLRFAPRGYSLWQSSNHSSVSPQSGHLGRLATLAAPLLAGSTDSLKRVPSLHV